MNLTFFLNWKSNRWNILKSISGKFTTNWAWEFNLYATHSWIMVDARVLPNGDHRGAFIMLGIFGYAVDINIYDVRHNH
jgi:hypothetical protein